jgi:hypothetical protein
MGRIWAGSCVAGWAALGLLATSISVSRLDVEITLDRIRVSRPRLRPALSTGNMLRPPRRTHTRHRDLWPSRNCPVFWGKRAQRTCSHIGAPRPTRSRVTMTGGRFPGSRIVASDHLPSPDEFDVPFAVWGLPGDRLWRFHAEAHLICARRKRLSIRHHFLGKGDGSERRAR